MYYSFDSTDVLRLKQRGIPESSILYMDTLCRHLRLLTKGKRATKAKYRRYLRLGKVLRRVTWGSTKFNR